MRKNVKVHAKNPKGDHAKNARKKHGDRKPKKGNSKEKKSNETSLSNTGNNGDPTIHHDGEKKLENNKSSLGLLVSDNNSPNRDHINPSPDPINSADSTSPTNQNKVVTENEKPVPGLDNKLENSSGKVPIKTQAQAQAQAQPQTQPQGVKNQTAPPKKEIRTVRQSPRSSWSSNDSCKSTAPGLNFLEGTSGFYVFKRSDPLDFIEGSILVSSYNVMNDKGETIFYIGETQEKCILCASWSHRLPIYSVQEQLVMSLLRRNTSCCSHSSEMQMAKIIDADLAVHAEESFVYPPKAAYHINLPSGEFLGHIKVFDQSELFDEVHPFKYVVIDEKYQDLYKIRDVKPTDPDRATDDSISNHYFEEATDSRYDIYYEHRKLGNIHSKANVRKFGLEIESSNCFHATYPPNLTDVQKALILGLLAVTKCQTISADDHVCEACFTLICKNKCDII